MSGGAGSTIGGTAAGEGNVISGAARYGVYIKTSDNLVIDNRIGTDPTGTTPMPDGTGVEIAAGTFNTIGGTAAGAGNVISGNTGDGVDITGAGASGNLVEGNLIGTNAGGTAALKNSENGILIEAPDNTIGGTAAGAGNVISGSTQFGVQISGSGVTGNLVEGNWIGLSSGGAALGNFIGVEISAGATNNTVGGLTSSPGTGAGNVISGNMDIGVFIQDATTSGNVVAGNLLGTDSTGQSSLGSQQDGIYLQRDEQHDRRLRRRGAQHRLGQYAQRP